MKMEEAVMYATASQSFQVSRGVVPSRGGETAEEYRLFEDDPGRQVEALWLGPLLPGQTLACHAWPVGAERKAGARICRLGVRLLRLRKFRLEGQHLLNPGSRTAGEPENGRR